MLFVQIDRLFFLEKLKNHSFIISKRLVNEIFEHIEQQCMIKLVNTDAISAKIRSTLISTKASWNSMKRNHLKRNKFNVHNGSIRFPVRPLSSVIPIIISESETEKMDFDQTKNININEMLCELSIK